MHRIPEFDALRGLAAVTIVIHHLCFPSFTPMATAVNLFFVISGFLITGIVLRNRKEKQFLRTFYIRRSLRIWPIYYLALLAVVVINLMSSAREPMDGLPFYIVHLQKLPCYWLMPEPPFIQSFLHTWTLAIEEQFYLFWPLLICVAGPRALTPLALLFIAIPIVARTAGFSLWILISQCDGLALGGLLAGMLAERPEGESQRRRLHALLLGLCVFGAFFTIAGAPALQRFGEDWHPLAASLKITFTNVFYFGFVGLIVGFSGHPWLWILRTRLLGYLGAISYGLYLYHYIVVINVQDYFHRHGLLKGRWVDALTFVATMAIAALSWRFVEQPILALKDRWNYGAEPASPLEEEVATAPHKDVLVSQAS